MITRRHPRRRSIPQPVIVVAAMVIIAVAIALLWPNKKTGITTTQCPGQTLAQQAAAADVIMTGSVFMVLPDQDHALVIIDPIRIYKGQIDRPTIKIPAQADTAISSEQTTDILHFASGQPPYLLFLKHGSGQQYITARCFGTRELGSGLTAEERQILGSGKQFNAPVQ
jgi:hypothetical protein